MEKINRMILMSVKIPPEQVMKRINEFLTEITELRRLNFQTGEERKSNLETKIDGFTNATFTDHKERRIRLIGLVFGIIGHTKTYPEKEADYQNRLKHLNSVLLSWKTEIEMIQESQQTISQLDKTAQEIKEAEQEAKRRGLVVESKANGAIIELLDQLRTQIKEKDTTTKALLEINQNLNEIKEMLKNKLG